MFIARTLPVAVLSCFLFFHQPACAQDASVTGARMIWYGVYQAGSTTTIEDSASRPADDRFPPELCRRK